MVTIFSEITAGLNSDVVLKLNYHQRTVKRAKELCYKTYFKVTNKKLLLKYISMVQVRLKMKFTGYYEWNPVITNFLSKN